MIFAVENSIKETKLKRSEEHDAALNSIKKAIIKITQNKHFDTAKQRRARIKISRGAFLEKLIDKNWRTILYASRFFNSNEQNYSTNELELLAVVGSVEHYKYYLYGSKFKLLAKNKALLSALKNNRDKTYQSRPKRCVIRLLQFGFTVQHVRFKFSRYIILILAPTCDD